MDAMVCPAAAPSSATVVNTPTSPVTTNSLARMILSLYEMLLKNPRDSIRTELRHIKLHRVLVLLFGLGPDDLLGIEERLTVGAHTHSLGYRNLMAIVKLMGH